MLKETLVVSLIVLISMPAIAQSCNSWKGITPLRSTKDDVERILGKANSSGKYAVGYQTKEGRVTVFYSSGLCDENPEMGWNVREFTVISLTYSPSAENSTEFSELKLDQIKFERSPDPGMMYADYYTSKSDGIVVHVNTIEDTVNFFHFFPESKFDDLKCKK
ncbi:MAG: hypothetical protein IPN69_15225 [Acidobacteria bacterium]|nr:hypothetical protein [Acidobacteriota bacterium]MBK8147778.1 hypothetical protein [Acidobacteriota bacterium]MBK8812063.1 hypothetical protein [Acidobacteriota bacterium]